jgi:hypothetical protein
MIKIRPETIDMILLDTAVSRLADGNLREQTKQVEKKMKVEKCFLYKYLRKGPKSFPGYKLGANTTYSIIEEQLRLNNEQLEITREDTREAIKDLHSLMDSKTGRESSRGFSEKIYGENKELADYITAFVKEAPNPAKASGFIIGALAVYSAYEHAFKRKSGGR